MTSIVILGASADPAKISHRAVIAARDRGIPVYPVHPREAAIAGVPAFATVGQVPVSPEIVSVYLPAAVSQPLLRDIAATGCRELWLNPGADTPEVEGEALALGLRVVRTCTLEALQEIPRKR
ncbi:MAG: CoA-binding protein [Verrucomicrobiales bacterium]|nr:CoA-binding protein [Verrucomicrobiales bacterium]